MYAEGDAPIANPFDSAVLMSPVLPPTSLIGNCFSFWYHMVGTTMGTLNLFVDVGGVKVMIFHREGIQDVGWNLYQRTIAIDADFQVCTYFLLVLLVHLQELHLSPKLSMFRALSQNYQHNIER